MLLIALFLKTKKQYLPTNFIKFISISRSPRSIPLTYSLYNLLLHIFFKSILQMKTSKTQSNFSLYPSNLPFINSFQSILSR